MELFNEYKNKYFLCIQDIINDICDGADLREEDIFRLLISRGIQKKNNKNKFENLELKDALLNKIEADNKENQNLYLLKKDGRGMYKPSVPCKVPIRPTISEIQWLRMLLEDKRLSLFLEDKTMQKLGEKLEDMDNLFNKDYFLEKNIDFSDDEIEDVTFQKTLKVLIKAIEQNKFVKYTSRAKDGTMFNEEVAFPFRIEHSIRNDKFRLSAFALKDRRIVKINISGMQTAEVIEEVNDELREKAYEEIRSKRCEEPLVLEVENRRNSVERCFSVFSFYEKEAYFNRGEKKHELKIYYYEFDEAEIIKDILSLGSSVVVVKPESVREKVIEKLKKAFFLYEV